MKLVGLVEALAQGAQEREGAALTGVAPAPHHPCFVAGYHDAQRGHTACPYGVPECAGKWAEGYDFADEQGEAVLPRFGKIAGKRRKA
jgi:hypothetical protein